MPTGGVSTKRENLEGWFNAGVSCVGMGSKLISKEILVNGDYAALENKVKTNLETIGTIRMQKTVKVNH
jgi:2-dehydro-3-deoxyphosphogluconate aldolase/(4S)-4-hydroxy-2-oxoglutarate aldolase